MRPVAHFLGWVRQLVRPCMVQPQTGPNRVDSSLFHEPSCTEIAPSHHPDHVTDWTSWMHRDLSSTRSGWANPISYACLSSSWPIFSLQLLLRLSANSSPQLYSTSLSAPNFLSPPCEMPVGTQPFWSMPVAEKRKGNNCTRQLLTNGKRN